jgi:hypothetical protein
MITSEQHTFQLQAGKEMNTLNLRKHCKVSIFVWILIGGMSHAFAQEESSRQAIGNLVAQFVNAAEHGQPLQGFFDPDTQKRETAAIQKLASTPFRRFSITDFQNSKIQFRDSNHANVKATVEWETPNETDSTTTTISFVNVGNTWYFANPDFWQVNLGVVFHASVYRLWCGVWRLRRDHVLTHTQGAVDNHRASISLGSSNTCSRDILDLFCAPTLGGAAKFFIEVATDYDFMRKT